MKRSLGVLLAAFVLLVGMSAGASLPPAESACVSLDEGSSSSSGSSGGSGSTGSTSGGPSFGGSSGSTGGGSSSGVSIGQGDDIKGFQGLPWGATPDMVREKFGQPTYGQWENYGAAMRELTDNRGWSLPNEVDYVLGWGEYREGNMKSDGFLWAGFSERDGRKRLVWIYKLWPNLKEGKYDYITDHQRSQIEGFFGSPIKKEKKADDNSQYFIPFGDDEKGWRDKEAGYWWHWEGRYGYVRYIQDHNGDWVGVTYHSKLLKNARAEFPSAGKLSNLDLGGGSGSDQSQGSDTYGKIIESAQKGRIDSFRGTPWGGTPDECLSNSDLGEPKARNGRERAKRRGLNLPNEGKTVWVYEENILNATARVWLSFENYHKPGKPGLIWTATTWDGLSEENFRRVKEDITKLLKRRYESPAKDDLTRDEADSQLGFDPSSDSLVWFDDYGRLLRHANSDRGSVVVQYQSKALLEKREAEVDEAGAKF